MSEGKQINFQGHGHSYYRTSCRVVKVEQFPVTLGVYVHLMGLDHLAQEFPVESQHYFASAMDAIALVDRLGVGRHHTVERYLVMHFGKPHARAVERKSFTPTLYEAVYTSLKPDDM